MTGTLTESKLLEKKKSRHSYQPKILTFYLGVEYLFKVMIAEVHQSNYFY